MAVPVSLGLRGCLLASPHHAAFKYDIVPETPPADLDQPE
jgi:hypothetical protein